MASKIFEELLKNEIFFDTISKKKLDKNYDYVLIDLNTLIDISCKNKVKILNKKLLNKIIKNNVRKIEDLQSLKKLLVLITFL